MMTPTMATRARTIRYNTAASATLGPDNAESDENAAFLVTSTSSVDELRFDFDKVS